MGARGKLKLAPALSVVPVATEGTLAADVQPVTPPKPAAVAADPALSGIWDEVVPLLESAAMVSPMDVLSLELMLRHFRAARDASDELASSGSSTLRDEKNGREMKHPAEVVFRSESLAFLEYAKQHGMTFLSRVRAPSVKDSSGGESNPFASTGTA